MNQTKDSAQKKYFNRYVALLAMAGDPAFISFLEEARPQVVQMGFYGPQLYAFGDTELGSGYPMNLPVRGVHEVLDWQKQFNQKIHDIGGKVIGHFSMTIAWGDPEKNTGFFESYNGDSWHTELLGPKPVDRIDDLVHKQPDGQMIVGDRYGFPWVAGCSNNPNWRKLHRKMVEVAITRCDVDGFVSLYNYNHGCACDYCNHDFRAYLLDRYSPKEINSKFDIDNLDSFRLDGTLGKSPGWIDRDSPHPVGLQIEAMRFSQFTWKQHYDEIFIETGRKLKPDLILGSWNHLGFMKHHERNVMPKEMWGCDEDLLWYSTGAGTGTVADGDAGVRMLNLKFIWELSGHKLPVLGRYEGTRTRASIAEGLACQGPGMGLYCNWKDPDGSKAFIDYFHFAEEFQSYYHPVESYAEVALVFPRQVVLKGDDQPVENFRKIGQFLMDTHILFDVLSDQNISVERLDQYRGIVLTDTNALSERQAELLAEYATQKNPVIVPLGSGDAPGFIDHLTTHEKVFPVTLGDRAKLVSVLHDEIYGGVSTFDTMWTVRINAYLQTERIVIHFVNYNRIESKDSGPANESPIAISDVGVNLRLKDSNKKIAKVTFLSPEIPYREDLTWNQDSDRLHFQIRSMLVYGVVVIDIAP